MDLDRWREILAAYDDLDRQIEGAFANPAQGVNLDDLRRSLRRRAEALRLTLGASMPAEAALEVLVPLVFWCDEAVVGRLAQLSIRGDLSWALLQRDLFAVGDGGDVFYERLDELLRRFDTPQILLETYLFCLNAGFEGRHVDEPPVIARYREALAARVATPALPAEPAPETPVPRATSEVRIALLAAAAAVAFHVILFAVSRTL
jgi:type VI protein secretion system component VasF